MHTGLYGIILKLVKNYVDTENHVNYGEEIKQSGQSTVGILDEIQCCIDISKAFKTKSGMEDRWIQVGKEGRNPVDEEVKNGNDVNNMKKLESKMIKKLENIMISSIRESSL